MKVRSAILTFACIGLLSTVSYGAGGGTGTTTDPMGQTNQGTGGAAGGMGSGPSGMGSESQGMGAGQSLSIQGEITSVEDEMYVVKDSSGREISLHVDQSTQKSGEFEEGDQIKAEVTPDGHALKLEKDDQSILQ